VVAPPRCSVSARLLVQRRRERAVARADASRRRPPQNPGWQSAPRDGKNSCSRFVARAGHQQSYGSYLAQPRRCAIPGAPSRLRLTPDNVQLLQPVPEGVGWMFGTEVTTGWSLSREGLPSQVDADRPRHARWAKFRPTMRDASSEPGCSRDQEQGSRGSHGNHAS
jgi:hypothetical protein